MYYMFELLCGGSLLDKFLQCPESVSHLLPFRQQLIEDRRVCGRSTVQKHDGTGMDAAEKLFECFFLCRLLILIPVHIGETPEEGLIAEILCHLKIHFAVFSLGRPVVFPHGLPCDLCVECFEA